MATGATGTKLGSSGAVFGALATMYDQRWLAVYFIRHQLSRRYRTSFLGVFWMFLIPLFTVVLYTLIFSEIIGLRFNRVEGESTLNFGLYVYCGLIPFLACTEALILSVTSIRSNTTLVTDVVFPAEILPLSSVVTALVTNTVGLGVLIIILAGSEQRFYWTLLLLPLVMVLQSLFILGLSYGAAVIGAYVPDAREVVNTVVRAMLFLTPIFWPAERVPEYLRFLVDYNPLAYLVGAYRDLVLEGRLPGGAATLWFGLFAGFLAVIGFFVFVRLKPQFADFV